MKTKEKLVAKLMEDLETILFLNKQPVSQEVKNFIETLLRVSYSTGMSEGMDKVIKIYNK